MPAPPHWPPSPDLIRNLKTRLERLKVSGLCLPVTINDGARTCYLCCPSAAYLDYAHEERRALGLHWAVSALMGGVIEMARPLMLLSGLDRQVQVNNALISTNVLPSLNSETLIDITAGLVKTYPDHAIVWRSVNDHDPSLIDAFGKAGYKALASRRVYVLDARQILTGHRSRDARRDAALLGWGDYVRWEPKDIRPTDFERIADLYDQLYIGKYTSLNPQYTAEFLRQAHNSGFLEFQALATPEGRIDGVIGFYVQGETLTAPVVGYDTTLPQALGLYRRLMAIGLERAQTGRYLYNMSAGAGAFKRNRGAVGVFEYMMVYDRHLPVVQRTAISTIAGILDRFAKPMLLRYAP